MENFLVLSFYCLWGLIWGSFAGVLVSRIPKGESILVPARSYCPTCKKTLTFKELIPVLSYLWQRGKCRSCENRIPLEYLLVELGSAVIWCYVGWKFSFPLSMGIGFFLLVLWVCAWIDLNEGIIPDVITLPLLAFFLVKVGITSGLSVLFQTILVGTGIPLYFALFQGMGWGDVKLFAVLALAFGGLAGIRILVWASIFSLVYYLFSRQREFPFGPFILLGTIAIL